MSEWNKPTAKPVEVKKAAKPALKRVLIASGVIAVLGCVLLLVFSGGDDAPKAKEGKQAGLIKEVKPNIAPTNAVAAKPVDPREDYDHERFYRDERGILRYMTGVRAYDPTLPISSVYDPAARTKPPIFSNDCDVAISRLLLKRPGSHVGSRQNYYDPDLEEEFKASLTQPIRISPDDTERNKRLKQAVIDARREIAERIGGGEKLGDILTQTRNELRRLYEYRNNLEDEVCVRIEQGDMSDDDVRDIVNAANVLFEKEGLAPLKADSFVSWNLRLAGQKYQKGND